MRGVSASEVAASLRQQGGEVAMVEPLKLPLAHILGEDIGRVFESFHREHGVQMYFEELAARFEDDGLLVVEPCFGLNFAKAGDRIIGSGSNDMWYC